MFKAIGRIFERKSTRALRDPWAALLLGGAAPTVAGIAVSPESALRCPAVLGSIKVLAETLAMLSPHLYRRLPGGGRERADDHPIAALLTDQSNPWTPASAWRMQMEVSLALHGNAYSFINRDSQGRPVELVQLDPNAVSVEPDPVTMEPRYFVSAADGARREYDRRDILHIHTLGTRPHQGDSPVTHGREAIGLAVTLERHAAGLFGRGAKPSGVLKHAKMVGGEVLARLRGQFEQFYSGAENAGKTMILEDGMSFEQLQMTSVDSQLLELRKFQTAEVSRLWRVPLHLLNDLDRTTHNNAEHMGQQFLSYCLLPLLRLWEDALSLSLLTPEERKTLYVEFLTDELARADLAARFTAYSQAINAGILNPNECRQAENRAPYAGGETYMRPVNTAPAPTTPSKTEAGNV